MLPLFFALLLSGRYKLRRPPAKKVSGTRSPLFRTPSMDGRSNPSPTRRSRRSYWLEKPHGPTLSKAVVALLPFTFVATRVKPELAKIPPPSPITEPFALLPLTTEFSTSTVLSRA